MILHRLSVLLVLASVLTLGAVSRASAHPHVWVSVKTEFVYGPDGELKALKEAWTFDEAFSAFALQGMAKTKNGTYGDDVLKPLAQVNIDAMKESSYFTYGKTASHKIPFADPVDYFLTYADDTLTLHFTLPLKKPMPPKGTMVFETYDPEFYVSFSFAEKNPIVMAHLPKGCVSQLVRPDEKAQTTKLSEAFFNDPNASANYGAMYADKVLVNCP